MKQMASDYKNVLMKMGEVYSLMQGIVEAANGADAGMTAEQEAQYNSLKATYATLGAQKARNEELMGMENTAKNTPGAPVVRESAKVIDAREAQLNKQWEVRSTESYAHAFEQYLRNGEHTAPQFIRALGEASGQGGTVIPPIEYDAQLTAKIQTLSAIRQVSKIMNCGSFQRNIAVEATQMVAGWTAEATAPGESSPTYTAVTLTPKRLAGLLKVSNELIEDSNARSFNMQSIIAEQAARILAETEETGFLVGTGASNQPTGITTDSALTTSASTITGPTVSQVITWVYSLARQYRKDAVILINDNTASLIRQLPNITNGLTNLLWVNSTDQSEPDRLMGIPVYITAGLDSVGANKIIGLIGSFKNNCVIGQRSNFEMKTLRERYADANQTGYLFQNRVDIALTLPALAFKALKCAAS
jgi:HK97 family phage major capsid protein